MADLIIYKGGSPLLRAETAVKIARFEKQVKELTEKHNALKQAILAEMEQKNLVKLETPELSISYIAPSERETFDSKAFRAAHEDLYDEFAKLTPVKAQVRVKLK